MVIVNCRFKIAMKKVPEARLLTPSIKFVPFIRTTTQKKVKNTANILYCIIRLSKKSIL